MALNSITMICGLQDNGKLSVRASDYISLLHALMLNIRHYALILVWAAVHGNMQPILHYRDYSNTALAAEL